MVELQIEPYAVRTRARYALFLELAGDLEIGERLQHGHRPVSSSGPNRCWPPLGIPDPVVTSRALMALLRRAAPAPADPSPGLDMRLAVERAVRALARSDGVNDVALI